MCGVTRTLGNSRGRDPAEAAPGGYVEGGPDTAGPELRDERVGLDRSAASGVHHERAVRQEAQPTRVQQALRLAGQRQDVHEDLGVAEDVVEVGQAAHAVACGSPDAGSLQPRTAAADPRSPTRSTQARG